MTRPFVDQSQKEYEREQDASARVAHLSLVRGEMAGGEHAADDEVQRLAVDFAEATDSTNYLLAYYAQNSEKFPDFSKRVRCFLDAVIGATAGRADYVEVTDAELAARMGCSDPKTVQRARNEFRSWPEYGKLCGIKDNWQHPDTKKSHPHAYLCHLTLMSATATADARLSPRYGSEDERSRVFGESAKMRAMAQRGSLSRPPKKRRKLTDSELLLSDVGRAASALEKAAKRESRHVDPDDLQAEVNRAFAALSALAAAHGLSIQNTEERKVDTEEGENPVGQDYERRVDSTVAAGGVDKMSTQNDVTESTTCEVEADSEWAVSKYVWMEGGEVCWKFLPDDAPPWLVDAVNARYAELKGDAYV